MSAAVAASRPVNGFVEAVTTTAVLGWVWAPGHGQPLAVELLLGDQVVARTVADELREDLARNGVGEGRHAFSLPVAEALRPRLGELRVIARSPDGDAVVLGRPPAEPGLEARLNEIQRGMEMLVASQRVLHRNVQAALLRENGAASEHPGETFQEMQTGLQQQLSTLEVFVTRLEARLAAFIPEAGAPAPLRDRSVVVALVLSALALAGSIVGLLRAVPV